MRTTITSATLLTLLAFSSAQDTTTSLSPDESLVSILSTEGPGISDLISTLTDPLATDLPTSTLLPTDSGSVSTTSLPTISGSESSSPLPIETGIVPGNGTTTTSGAAGGTGATLTRTESTGVETATRTELSTAPGGSETGVVGGGDSGSGGQEAQPSGDTQDGAAAANGVPLALAFVGLVAVLGL